MKKRLFFLTLILIFCAATALAQTVTAIPSDIDLAHLAHKEYCAGIEAYNADDHTITITLYKIEAFTVDDVKSLAPGDVIVSGGAEYVVETVLFGESDRYCIVNAGEYDFEEGSLTLMYDSCAGNYKPT